MTLKRFDKCCFLTAYERTCTGFYHKVTAEIRTEYIIAYNTLFSCLLQSVFKTLNCKRILCSYVYNRMLCSDSVSTDKHTLNKIVRVGLDNGSVHKCTGVAFVSVAYEIFFFALALTCSIPFEPCREACTASSCKSGSLDNLNYFFRCHTTDCLFKSCVAVFFDIFINNFRVDDTAVSESDTCLF